ncbi:MAG: YbjQ family protein [Candidatus Omnitrophica bacterium]|nr:YbjQ family protein [Candidatus Omnitrophota bacterium]
MSELFIIIVFIACAYFIGNFIENRHYNYIKEREKRFLNLYTVTTKDLPLVEEEIYEARLVYGSVVISVDYFKRILAGLRNIFGGEVSSYETLLDRARREAVLRMKERAKDAIGIVNLRLETSAIGQSANKRGGIGSVEILAYGTAIIPKRK